MLIEAPAGQGKSTLLKFLVSNWSIRRLDSQFFTKSFEHSHLGTIFEFAGGDASTLPFFIRLRDISDGDLNISSLLNLAQGLGNAPEGWLLNAITSRSTVVVLDGIDEISNQQRKSCKSLINFLVRSFPLCRIIISGRPLALSIFAKGAKWPVGQIMPLTLGQQLRLVSRWYVALSNRAAFAFTTERLDQARYRLLAVLQSDRRFASLASTPLICSALCLLSIGHSSGLPAKLFEICNSVCRMLISMRDQENSVIFRDTDGTEISLTTVQIEFLMGFFAGILVKRQASSLSIDEFNAELASAGLGSNGIMISPELAMAIGERTGLIRLISDQNIEFIHNIFKEYFATSSVLRGGLKSSYLNLLNDEAFRNCVTMCCETSHVEDYSSLVDSLINASATIKTEERREYDLFILACLISMPLLKKAWISVLSDLQNKFIPPQSNAEAIVLAKADDSIARLLSCQNSWSHKTKLLCIRALGLMSTVNAKMYLKSYADSDNRDVQNELIKYLNPLDLPFFRSMFLHAGSLPADISKRVTSLQPLSYNELSSLKSINISHTAINDIREIEFATELYEFIAVGSLIRDISPLSKCALLRRVIIDFTPISNIDDLFNMKNLEYLSLDYTLVSKIPSIKRGCMLKVLNIRRTAIQSEDLIPYRGTEIGIEL